MTVKILFICKNRDVAYRTLSINGQSESYCDKKSSGLLNSVKFVVNMLTKANIECKLVDVIDNNAIDREVTLYQPTHVIIEALWVVPSKFEILQKLHPNVNWIVRLHSELPFIAGEGIAMEWIYDYTKYKNVTIACNSKRIADQIEYLIEKPVAYLPNYYDVAANMTDSIHIIEKDPNIIDIGCFGAIRPLKNQFTQAIAAMEFATKIGKKLRFHINGTRIEGKGDANLKNIRNLFAKGIHGHELIEHEWMEHKTFVSLLGQMDILLQVSFTETYNIVAADAISQDVSVVSSDEIRFVFPLFHADCTNVNSIVFKLFLSHYLGKIGFNKLNYYLLKLNASFAKRQWLSIFKRSF